MTDVVFLMYNSINVECKVIANFINCNEAGSVLPQIDTLIQLI